jgi:hypothetical protein
VGTQWPHDERLIPTILISKDAQSGKKQTQSLFDELESANDKATDANVKQCANDNAKCVHGCKCQTMCKTSNGQFENCCDADKGQESRKRSSQHTCQKNDIAEKGHRQMGDSKKNDIAKKMT